MVATGETVGLAEEIIDDTCLVPIKHYNQQHFCCRRSYIQANSGMDFKMPITSNLIVRMSRNLASSP